MHQHDWDTVSAPERQPAFQGVGRYEAIPCVQSNNKLNWNVVPSSLTKIPEKCRLMALVQIFNHKRQVLPSILLQKSLSCSCQGQPRGPSVHQQAAMALPSSF